ncbi:CRISPR-associated ring nuclease Csm6 [Thiohalobacter sp. IOR34]|uniref:CRISPR-associated ring nuclease Csm6 n=1 Tax=Thiohalobacter sp. IOR34 TaxID=3057176 RepID=UPI0025AF1085|nr:CRISPR-associated ring nuclease Csm6 [Thiohalobacter sp. IOR34]WJW76663.1 CRISPR-associated ring nuclease Csm6 [Thiohalobacter sp. IOR34]
MTNNRSRPSDFPRRILLAVTGLSPQVVTETLYALIKKAPRFVPTEIHLITTAEGAERARLSLLHEETGWFHRLCADYELSGVSFGEECIHVIQDPAGGALSDIRTPEENERTADQIVEQVQKLTSDERSALHASIAGGRKTMGFYLGYAMSLYGRPQDRLSHVLVSAPFESHPDFFYPTPESRIIYTPGPDSKPLDTHMAEVTLAEIPYVRLRHGLDERLTDGKTSFSEAVASAQAAVGPVRLVIDLEGKRIEAGGKVLHLPPTQLAFLSWLARRKAEGHGPVRCPCDGAPEPNYAKEYVREYEEIADPQATGTATGLKEGMSKNFFEQTQSRLHRELKKVLGPAGRFAYGVISEGKPKRYELAVGREDIEWGMIRQDDC